MKQKYSSLLNVERIEEEDELHQLDRSNRERKTDVDLQKKA